MGARRGSFGAGALCAASATTSQPLCGRSQVSAIDGRPAIQCCGESSTTGTRAASRVFEHLRTPQPGDPARVRCGLGQPSSSRTESLEAAAPNHAGVARSWRERRGSTWRAKGERESKRRAATSPLLSADIRTTTGKCTSWESRRAGNGVLYAGRCVCTLLCVSAHLTHTRTRDGLRNASLLSCSPTPRKQPLIWGNAGRARRRATTDHALPLSRLERRSRARASVHWTPAPVRDPRRAPVSASAPPRPSLALLRLGFRVAPVSC